MDLWSVLWVGIAAGVIGLVTLVRVATRRPSVQDLGSVSSQWIAEERGSQADGSIR